MHKLLSTNEKDVVNSMMCRQWRGYWVQRARPHSQLLGAHLKHHPREIQQFEHLGHSLSAASRVA